MRVGTIRVGDRYPATGRGLTVVDLPERVFENNRSRYRVHVRCDCGQELRILIDKLGDQRSCGCGAVRRGKPKGAPQALMITWNGRTHSLTEWASIVGISSSTLRRRVRDEGCTMDEAILRSRINKKPATRLPSPHKVRS